MTRRITSPGIRRGVCRARLELRHPDTPFEERSAFSILMGEQATISEGAHALYESRNLPDDTYVAQLDWVASLMATPGGARWWEDWAHAQPASVTRAINERLAQGGLDDPRAHDNYRRNDRPAAQQSAAADSAQD